MVTGLLYFRRLAFSGARGNVSDTRSAPCSWNETIATRISENCVFAQLILRAEHAVFRWQMGRQKTTEKQTKVLPPCSGGACFTAGTARLIRKNVHEQYKICFHYWGKGDLEERNVEGKRNVR